MSESDTESLETLWEASEGCILFLANIVTVIVYLAIWGSIGFLWLFIFSASAKGVEEVVLQLITKYMASAGKTFLANVAMISRAEESVSTLQPNTQYTYESTAKRLQITNLTPLILLLALCGVLGLQLFSCANPRATESTTRRETWITASFVGFSWFSGALWERGCVSKRGKLLLT
ncbi:hypothetical protein B0J14DRAFT_564302 [Halenospora varia]|nr:hypothetical protein B0J14DRAFT_564302 [Halenospora varia]